MTSAQRASDSQPRGFEPAADSTLAVPPAAASWMSAGDPSPEGKRAAARRPEILCVY